MPLITLGDSTKLQVKVPSKGDTNWESDFKTEFAQKIVDHDHTGVDGKGTKIAEAAIEDGAITTAKIADGAVTSVKIAADAVADIDLAPNSVGTSELKDANVTNAKLGFECVSTDKLETYAVTTAKIADDNVTTAKIADANVTAAKIGSDVVLSTLNNVSSTAPSAGQVLKWDGSSWGPGTDASSAGSGVITISNQTDANSYSNSAGDILVIDASVDVSFSSAINDTTIFITGNDDVTFSSLSSCTVKGGSGNITCGDLSTSVVNTPGNFTYKNTSGATYMTDSMLVCETLRLDVDAAGSLNFNRTYVFADRIINTGTVGGNIKILINSGAILECRFFGVTSTFADVTLNTAAKLTVNDTFNGKIYDATRSAVLLDRTSSENITIPFEINENVFTPQVPVAGRFGISSDTTAATSSDIFLNIDSTLQANGGLTLTGTGKVEIPYTGWYQLGAGIYISNLDNTNDNATVRWRISVNNSSRVYSEKKQSNILTEKLVQDTASVLYYCQAGDEIGIRMQVFGDGDNSVVVKSTTNATFLTIQMVK